MWLAGPARRVPGGVVHGALNAGLHLVPGMSVGLFGGSFDPAHEGHALVAETARKRLGLDRERRALDVGRFAVPPRCGDQMDFFSG